MSDKELHSSELDSEEVQSPIEEDVSAETVEDEMDENETAEKADALDDEPGDAQEQSEQPADEEEDPVMPEDLDEETQTSAEAEEENSGKKKRRFLNQSKKDKRDEKIEELNDRLLRNMAEFENFRNRSEKEKSAMFEIGAKSVVEKILPVVDNFERGLDAVSDEEKDNAFVKGMEAVYKQFSTVLEEIGVVAIEAVGKEFDPNLHNAVMHDEDDSMEANMISEEFQKGYMYKDSVVRHSMVKVVN